MSVKIEQFCGGHGIREYLARPFRWYRHSYATNGHIMVRVPVREGDPRLPKKVRAVMKVDRPIEIAHKQARFVSFTDAMRARLPKLEPQVCSGCNGRGEVREVDSCVALVECGACDGLGFSRPRASIMVAGTPFDCHYIGLIAPLPRAEIAATPVRADFKSLTGEYGHMLAFRFDGGVGAVMALRCPLDDHRGELFGEAAE